MYRLTSSRSQGTLCNIFSRSATLTHLVLAWTCITYTWKELPTGFFFKKVAFRRDRIFHLKKSLFSRGAKTPILRARSALFRKFWRSSGAQGRVISRSVSSPQKKLRALCQRNSTELKRFHSLERRQSDRMTLFLRFLKIISRTTERAIAPASQS